MAKFLLIEDDELAQLSQGQTLRDLGHNLDIVSDAKQAMQALLDNKHHYDGIFIDIGLPDADGIMLSAEMRTMFNVYVPIIAVTASMPEKRWEACKRVGIDDFILKPATIIIKISITQTFMSSIESQSKICGYIRVMFSVLRILLFSSL